MRRSDVQRVSFSPLFLATVVVLAVMGSAASLSAQTVFIPINFGAAYEPQQLNDQLMNSATADQRLLMKSIAARDALLNERFPELTLPDVTDIERRFMQGNQSYFNGKYDAAVQELNEAFEEATARLSALTLRQGFAEATYMSGLYLVQLHYFVRGNQDDAETVIKELVRYFPSQVPNEEQFPPDLVEVYLKHLPKTGNGVKLNIRVDTGCFARINGHDLDMDPSVNLTVLPGSYGIAEICNDRTTRAYVVPVTRDTVVDFHDDFANAYTYPAALTLNAQPFLTQPEVVGRLLATVGSRVEAKFVFGAGLIPDGSPVPAGYRVMLVDVDKGQLVREFTVRPAEVATREGMADLLNALWTGEELKVVSLRDDSGGVTWTTIGIITASTGGVVLAAGAVFGVLAMTANSDFEDCNKDAACRLRGDDIQAIKDRNLYSTVADILYGTGGAILTAGLIMIIVDQVSGTTPEEKALRTWDYNLAGHPDGGVSMGVTYRW